MSRTASTLRRRAPLVAASTLVAAAALGAAACGGGSDDTGGSASVAASYVPSSSPMYFEVTTDLDGPQWTEIKALAEIFPAYPQLQAELQESLSSDDVDFERDVQPLLGERAVVAATSIDGAGALGATSDTTAAAAAADDASQDVVGVFELADGKRGDVEALLTRTGEATAQGEHQGATLYAEDDSTTVAVTDDAVVVAQTREQVVAALDAHAQGGDATLAGTSKFTDALGKLPEDVFGRMYMDVGALAQSGMSASPQFGQLGSLGDLQDGAVAASLLAEPDGLRIKGVATGVEDAAPAAEFTPELVSNVPADALAYFEVSDTSGTLTREIERYLAEADPETAEQVRSFSEGVQPLLGVTVDQLKALGAGNQAFIALPGASEIPGLVILASVEDGGEAKTTLDSLREALPNLLQMVGGSSTEIPAWTQVSLPGGVSGQFLEFEPGLGVLIAVSGDLVVVASSPEAATAVLQPEAALADSAEYAAGTVGLPGSVTSLGWINLTETVDQLGRAGVFEDAPAEVLPNLRPLRSAALWSAGGDEPTFESFIRISE